jgi:hypothetical protein
MNPMQDFADQMMRDAMFWRGTAFLLLALGLAVGFLIGWYVSRLYRKCPKCQKDISAKATVCPKCRSDLSGKAGAAASG